MTCAMPQSGYWPGSTGWNQSGNNGGYGNCCEPPPFWVVPVPMPVAQPQPAYGGILGWLVNFIRSLFGCPVQQNAAQPNPWDQYQQWISELNWQPMDPPPGQTQQQPPTGQPGGQTPQGPINGQQLTDLMKIYSPDGSYSAEELRAAAAANSTNPELQKALSRMADMAESYGKEISADDLNKLASQDGGFSADEVFNLPEILGWGNLPETSHMDANRKDGAYSYIQLIQLMKEFDNGDGVYTPEELRAAAQKYKQSDEFGTELLTRLAYTAEAYGQPITRDNLQQMAAKSGDPAYFQATDVSSLPEMLCWPPRIAHEDEDNKYADCVVLLQILDRFNGDGNQSFSKAEIEAAIDAIENGQFPGINKDVYVDVLENLLDVADKHNGQVPQYTITALAHKFGDDRWISRGDVDDDNMRFSVG